MINFICNLPIYIGSPLKFAASGLTSAHNFFVVISAAMHKTCGTPTGEKIRKMETVIEEMKKVFEEAEAAYKKTEKQKSQKANSTSSGSRLADIIKGDADAKSIQ